MSGTKQARNFGGRPVEREPEPGKRAHLSAAIPLSLKRKVEQAAKKRGWSVSNETAHRLEMSFSNDLMTDIMLNRIREEFARGLGMFGRNPGGKGLLGDAVLKAEKKRSK